MAESYEFAEVVELEIPFTDAAGATRRPALVLLDTGDDDVVVARITGRRARDQFDLTVTDVTEAGLQFPWTVRPHKIATLEKSPVAGRLGRLSQADAEQVRVAIRRFWQMT